MISAIEACVSVNAMIVMCFRVALGLLPALVTVQVCYLSDEQ
jgi:hypothetical protein